MKRIYWRVGLAFLTAAATISAAENDWKPADGPLKTRWTKDVSPEKVWPEYPRPQMARNEWLNLNGLWDYTIIDNRGETPTSSGKILVPFPIESALSGVMKPLPEKHALCYQRSFTVPYSWSGQRVLLHFGAVNWEARVIVNGTELGTHRGGYDPFTYDITDALKPGRPHMLAVVVLNPLEGAQPKGKQVRDPKGIMYTASSGIWQTVWLEPVPQSSIADLKIAPDVDASVLHLIVTTSGAQDGDTVEAIALSKGEEIGRVRGKSGEELQIPIPHEVLWSPDRPFLYDLKIRLYRGATTLDTVKSYFAMRKINVRKEQNGITRLILNGSFVFETGPLDQGFWPDGLYTAPTDAAMRYDLEVTKKLGFNMTRKHVKVEPDRWYYYCDKLGLLVWQDMPSGKNTTDEDKKQFEQELKQLIITHYNHPCIIMWVVFNEGWGQFDTVRLASMVKEMDPSRLVNNATGWTDEKAGDVMDVHKYPGPDSPEPEEKRAAVLGEFGGLGLGLDGHTWVKKTWGYQGMSDRAALTEHYINLLQKVGELKASPGLSAAVYTQITDVESECNGLMTYDREIIKPDAAKVAAANRQN